MLDGIQLEGDQKELLSKLVVATRKLPREKKQGFVAFQPAGCNLAKVRHPGLQDGQIDVYMGDIDSLSDEGFIRINTSKDYPFRLFDVTLRGFEYYRQNIEQIPNIGMPKKEMDISDEESDPKTTKNEGNVFIVHGRDDSTKEKVAKFLKELGLKPIILHEQPNKGRTIIEKLEHYSSKSDFAVVLLTPDDFGGLKSEPEKQLRRARQNVVFEMGLFFGKLSRGRVCALLHPDVERPSDIEGIVYLTLDETEEWKSGLVRELMDSGLKVEQEQDGIKMKIRTDLVGGGTGLSGGPGGIRSLSPCRKE